MLRKRPRPVKQHVWRNPQISRATSRCKRRHIKDMYQRIGIRGYPSLILSDHGTQLVGAESELAKMIEGWDETNLKEYAAENQVEVSHTSHATSKWMWRIVGLKVVKLHSNKLWETTY